MGVLIFPPSPKFRYPYLFSDAVVPQVARIPILLNAAWYKRIYDSSLHHCQNIS